MITKWVLAEAEPTGLQMDEGKLKSSLRLLAHEMRFALTSVAAGALILLLGGSAFTGKLPTKRIFSVLIAAFLAASSGAVVGYLFDEAALDVTLRGGGDVTRITVAN